MISEVDNKETRRGTAPPTPVLITHGDDDQVSPRPTDRTPPWSPPFATRRACPSRRHRRGLVEACLSD
eukprot:9014528-Pyramimonas_sp.AAC.2